MQWGPGHPARGTPGAEPTFMSQPPRALESPGRHTLAGPRQLQGQTQVSPKEDRTRDPATVFRAEAAHGKPALPCNPEDKHGSPQPGLSRFRRSFTQVATLSPKDEARANVIKVPGPISVEVNTVTKSDQGSRRGLWEECQSGGGTRSQAARLTGRGPSPPRPTARGGTPPHSPRNPGPSKAPDSFSPDFPAG